MCGSLIRVCLQRDREVESRAQEGGREGGREGGENKSMLHSPIGNGKIDSKFMGTKRDKSNESVSVCAGKGDRASQSDRQILTESTCVFLNPYI